MTIGRPMPPLILERNAAVGASSEDGASPGAACQNYFGPPRAGATPQWALRECRRNVGRARRLDGLSDEPRSGRPRSVTMTMWSG